MAMIARLITGGVSAIERAKQKQYYSFSDTVFVDTNEVIGNPGSIDTRGGRASMPKKPLICFDLPKDATQYRLRGPQVQPDASYWHSGACPSLCIVRPEDILNVCPLPAYPNVPAAINNELEELYELASLRDDPSQVASFVPGRRRLGISPLLQYRPAPLGLQYNRLRPELRPFERVQAELEPAPQDNAVIRTGRELARAFENETPGTVVRHALEALLLQTGGPPPYFGWSPPMQSLLFAALDITIYSALLAAWHFKWQGGFGIGFRPRPVEVDPGISVLYDRAINANQSGDDAPRLLPSPHPGTPRHPAYPSGHSTVYAAAAELVAAFLPDRKAELDQLADNAGMARLWAGIHWRSDHEEGMRLGRCVAREVIKQLQRTCLCPPDLCFLSGACDCPETPESIEEGRKMMQECCEKGEGKKSPLGCCVEHEEPECEEIDC